MTSPTETLQASAAHLRGALRFLLDWLAYPYQAQLLALSGEQLEHNLRLDAEAAWCVRLTTGLERVVEHLDNVATPGGRP